MTTKTALDAPSPRFFASDILMSRTDTRGVIQSANKAFQTVSEYDWEELRNAPHKILRHPDMPRGVFWMFWDRLQAGQPFGAFIKNKSKLGHHYWVYASAAPLDGGYLSIRIKASDEAVAMISPIYADLLARERGENLTPDRSAAELVNHIQSKGYPSYDAFMSAMVADQLTLRDRARSASTFSVVSDFATVSKLWASVEEHCETILKAHKTLAKTPTNLRIQASRLSTDGIAMGAIANNFTALAQNITSAMEEFMASSEDVARTLDQSQFLVCFVQLMDEVIELFRSDAQIVEGIERDEEVARMVKKSREAVASTLGRMEQMSVKLGNFAEALQEIRSILSGLSVTRVMCQIEGTNLPPGFQSGISSTAAELDDFQAVAHENLSLMAKNLRRIRSTVNRSATWMESYHDKRTSSAAAKDMPGQTVAVPGE